MDDQPESDASDRVSDDEDRSSASDSSDADSQSDGDSDGEESATKAEPDHDAADTYRPSQGEDIYGNKLGDGESGGRKPGKYVPPHLRGKGSTQNAENHDAENQEKLRQIQRLLNNALNRLSDDTLISVAQQVVQVYSNHPTQMVNDMIWKNSMQACVATPMLMTGLIPAYVACLVGAHIQTGDTVQIGEFVLEKVVSEMWRGLKEIRKQNETRQNEDYDKDDDVNDELANKAACNLTVILCYLYNFNIVHCSFMYDIIRHLINEFTEVDIECLLLLLSHSGQSLRADDPLALKEIVLMVQKKNISLGRSSLQNAIEANEVLLVFL